MVFVPSAESLNDEGLKMDGPGTTIVEVGEHFGSFAHFDSGTGNRRDDDVENGFLSFVSR